MNSQIPSFNALIEKSTIEFWNHDALTDYKGITLQYHDVARKIEKLHILFEKPADIFQTSCNQFIPLLCAAGRKIGIQIKLIRLFSVNQIVGINMELFK